jgi:chitin synthase
MLVCGVLCIVEAVRQMDSPIFQRMVVSLIATYGIFIISSILALDPWHMFTCFLQYMLFQPSKSTVPASLTAAYINVLNIYAYANLHDLSWGTKGSDTVESDLGAVKGVGKDVEVHLVSGQQDIDSAYQDALDNIRVKRARVDQDEVPHKPEAKEQKQKDTYANFRTNLLLVWSLSNALLAGLILSGNPEGAFTKGGNKQSVYMLVILVMVAGMAAFRFICATLYLIIRLFVG